MQKAASDPASRFLEQLDKKDAREFERSARLQARQEQRLRELRDREFNIPNLLKATAFLVGGLLVAAWCLWLIVVIALVIFQQATGTSFFYDWLTH